MPKQNAAESLPGVCCDLSAANCVSQSFCCARCFVQLKLLREGAAEAEERQYRSSTMTAMSAALQSHADADSRKTANEVAFLKQQVCLCECVRVCV
jgi:hypothetical protein